MLDDAQIQQLDEMTSKRPLKRGSEAFDDSWFEFVTHLFVCYVMIIVALYTVAGLGNCEIWTKVSPDASETHRAQQDVVPGSPPASWSNTRRMIWKTGAVYASKLSEFSRT